MNSPIYESSHALCGDYTHNKHGRHSLINPRTVE